MRRSFIFLFSTYQTDLDWGSIDAPDDEYGYGRVDALRAMLAITRGDANNDDHVNVGDAVLIINYVFLEGAPPQPHILTGDANCDGICEIGDAVYIIAFVFEGGPPARICFEY